MADHTACVVDAVSVGVMMHSDSAVTYTRSNVLHRQEVGYGKDQSHYNTSPSFVSYKAWSSPTTTSFHIVVVQKDSAASG